jgi:hypothetical protein
MVSLQTRTDRLEWLVLRPLDLLLLLSAIGCLISGLWLAGGVLLVAAVFIGGVGHSLSEYNRMRRQALTYGPSIQQHDAASFAETYRITGAVFPVSLTLALATAILQGHAGGGMLRILVIGFCVLVFCDLAFVLTANNPSALQSFLCWLFGAGVGIFLVSKGARPVSALTAAGLTVLVALFISVRLRPSEPLNAGVSGREDERRRDKRTPFP